MAAISHEGTSAEWRSSDQVGTCTPSTSPIHWDSDEDEDGRPRPSELYGKHTWKIEKYSQITKRELRSNVFEAGGYKWYILIYPQGCDVSNHLSLFLCVANHDKLLPGWSHFAQFTIAVVNKDPKKSKYSDTLHRFWKKEHDWGWKKFMELSKLQDGFIELDTLIIKAQVQVIRERADRPFRCLDCQYRGELIRVYLTNVEQICRRFMEERCAKLRKFVEDRSRWSSLCAFWSSVAPDSKRRMSLEKMESILKVLVKHFFIEKEVTSTLVMDAMYSGLKTLENQEKGKNIDAEESYGTFIRIEEDSFILVDDVLRLLQNAALVSLPPKDEKGPQNRMKDGAAGDDFNKDSIERDERRLTDLGRQTLEIFVLGKIFSKIEAAYQEDVAFKKQEELIREEEEAWLAKKRGGDKEKNSKKKQGKQKHRKGKDKTKDNKTVLKTEQNRTIESDVILEAEPESIREPSDAIDNVSELSDSVDRDHETLPPDSEGREVSPTGWDTDTSEVNGLSDNASSTYSSVSVASPLTTGSHSYNNTKSPSILKNHCQFSPDTSEGISKDSADKKYEHMVVEEGRDSNTTSGSATDGAWSQVASRSLQDRGVKKLEHNVDEKVKKLTLSRTESPKAANAPSPTQSPSKSTQSIVQTKLATKVNTTSSPPTAVNKPSPDSPKQAAEASILENSSQPPSELKSEGNNVATQKSNEKPSEPRPGLVRPEKIQTQQHPLVISRPSSAPSVLLPKPVISSVTMVQPRPSLSRSISVVGQLGLEQTAVASHGYIPQSYRNVIAGNSGLPSSSTYSQDYPSMGFSMHSLASSSHISPAPINPNPMKPNVSVRMVYDNDRNNTLLQNRLTWVDWPQRDRSQSLPRDLLASVVIDEKPRLDSYNQQASITSGLAYDFPHLDIINDLLDEDHGVGTVSTTNMGYQNVVHGPSHLNRLNSFPSDHGSNLNPLGSTSCRYERTLSYHSGDAWKHGASSYDVRSAQFDPRPYMSGAARIDGYAPNQWQMNGVGSSSFPGIWGVESDGYPYGVDGYSTGGNSHEAVRPTNGL